MLSKSVFGLVVSFASAGPRLPHLAADKFKDIPEDLENPDARPTHIHEWLMETTMEANPSVYDFNDTLADWQQPILITGDFYLNEILPNTDT